MDGISCVLFMSVYVIVSCPVCSMYRIFEYYGQRWRRRFLGGGTVGGDTFAFSVRTSQGMVKV